MRHIWVVITVMLFLLFFGAGVISFVEGMSLVKAIYFTFITALAVGYGDITPSTLAGKLVSVFIGILGIVFFGIIIGISTRAIFVIMHPSEFEDTKT